jgi:prepilin-type N-terminal cleavage/methylation domain-containing protein/prepilin-type processing-associated H-X9-DG protein
MQNSDDSMYPVTFRPAITRGFTIVEMLVVLTIIGIFMALLLPAVNHTVSMARCAACQHNLSQLSLAVRNYEQAHEVYPPGTIDKAGPIRNVPVGYHHSWIVQLLPYLEQRPLHKHIDRSVGVYHPNNIEPAGIYVEQLHCPSDPPGGRSFESRARSGYAAVHHDVEAPIDMDNNGVFFLNSRVRYEDITDGHAHTLFLGDKYKDESRLGWMSGTRATLRNTGTPINLTGDDPPALWAPWPQSAGDDEYDFFAGEDVLNAASEADPPATTDAAPDTSSPFYVGGFGSYHGDGANMAFGDGRVEYLSQDTDSQLLRQLGHRADGQPLGTPPNKYTRN